MFVFPKHLYGAYKSADVHTTKTRLGFRAKLVIAALALAVGIFGYLFSTVGDNAAATAATQEAAAADAGDGSAVARSGAVATPISATDYMRRFVPRIASKPYSAPAWDDRKVVSEPQLVCIIGDTCHCLTEQGTKWLLPQDECVAFVLQGGVYNPFKRPERNASSSSSSADASTPAGAL
jgi:hypothetical protein